MRHRALGLLPLYACASLIGCARPTARPAPVVAVAGIYTKQQAERGRVLYEGTCAECHGARLEGGTSTPLMGKEFIASWGRPNLTLDDFYYIVRKTMPKEKPGTLARETYSDIVAFVLQQNGFPTGVKELTPDPEVMKTVRFGTPAAATSRSPHLAPR